jgi:hypothetical protein
MEEGNGKIMGIIGVVLDSVGVICFGIGVYYLFATFDSQNNTQTFLWFAVVAVGMILLGVGSTLIRKGFFGENISYTDDGSHHRYYGNHSWMNGPRNRNGVNIDIHLGNDQRNNHDGHNGIKH